MDKEILKENKDLKNEKLWISGGNMLSKNGWRKFQEYRQECLKKRHASKEWKEFLKELDNSPQSYKIETGFWIWKREEIIEPSFVDYSLYKMRLDDLRFLAILKYPVPDKTIEAYFNWCLKKNDKLRRGSYV